MKKDIESEEGTESRILLIRGERVILDSDLAEHYGVTTKKLKEEVKENKDRFPKDFMFKLNTREKAEVAENCEHLSELMSCKTQPYAFTEEGAIMVARVLNNMRAV